MMLDTRSPVFLDDLLKHLEKRLDLMLKAILTQDIGPKSKRFEMNYVNEIKTHLKYMLPLIGKTEKSLVNSKLFDRTKV
jgi:hypothetical protein